MIEKTVLPPRAIMRDIIIGDCRTSVRLEPIVWDMLEEVCVREGRTFNSLCTWIDDRRGAGTLTTAIRAFILFYFRKASALSRPDPGMSEAGYQSRPMKSALDACESP